jgi:hypothetical protein
MAASNENKNAKLKYCRHFVEINCTHHFNSKLWEEAGYIHNEVKSTMNNEQIKGITNLQLLFPVMNCGNPGPELKAREVLIIQINRMSQFKVQPSFVLP